MAGSLGLSDNSVTLEASIIHVCMHWDSKYHVCILFNPRNEDFTNQDTFFWIQNKGVVLYIEVAVNIPLACCSLAELDWLFSSSSVLLQLSV